MPLITPPNFVSTFLNNNGFDFQPNLLIIAENYPEPTFARYFYSPILSNFTNRSIPSFSKEIYRNFGVIGNNELTLLTDFLSGVGIGGGKRLLIDALPDGFPPMRPITQNRLNDLITDVINIDPNYILIMHNENKDVAKGFLESTRFAHLVPRLLNNPISKGHPNVFPFLSGRAMPIHFSNALNAVRNIGIPI
jgi:hypothetical protein